MKRSSTFGPALSALGMSLALALVVIIPVNAKELEFRGPSGYLYDECQGHCVYNWQCAGDLQCIKRDGKLTPVPGCSGLGKADVNYCANPDKPIVQPADTPEETRETQAEEEDGSGATAATDPIKALLESADVETGNLPDSTAVTYVGASKDLQPLLLGNCQGHCNSDEHCRPGLRCLNLPGQTYIPGCEGQLEDTGVAVCYDRAAAGVDFDNIPEDSETLLFVGKRNDGKNYNKQFGKCMGDCRVDNDCRGGLRCFEDDGSSVPGCLGVRVKGYDYCYDPNDSKSSSDLSYVALNPPYAIGHCEAHCTSDADCFGSLVCYNDLTSEDVPGCSGDRLFLKEDESFNYCVSSTDWPEYVPDNTSGTTTPAVGSKPNDDGAAGNSEATAETKPAEESVAGVEESMEKDEVGDTSVTNPQDPPPSSNLQPKPVEDDASETPVSYEPYKPSKVSISLPEIQLALTFNSPERIRRLAAARNLIINDDIDETGDLLAIIGGLLGEGIRRLGPTSYAGMLLDVAFVDETEDKGKTTVTYQFSGSSIFRNNDDFVQPSPRLMEAAALDALDDGTVYGALSQSGNPILQAVRTVDVTTVEEEEDESGVGATKQDSSAPSGGVSTGGIAALIIVLLLVCVAIVGMVYIKQKKDKDFWKRPQEKGAGVGTKRMDTGSNRSNSDDGTPVPVPSSPTKKGSTNTPETFSSPTRTHDTEVAETPPSTPDLGLPPNFVPDISNPYEDDRSIGGDSNWSFKNLGYLGRGGGDTGSIGSWSRGLSKKPTDFVNKAVEGPGDYCEQSVNDESLGSASLDGMSTNNPYIYPQRDAALNAAIPFGDHRIRTDETFNTIDTATIQRGWNQNKQLGFDEK